MSKDVYLPRISSLSIAIVFSISFYYNALEPVLEQQNKLIGIAMFLPVFLMLFSCLAYFKNANKPGVILGLAAGIILFIVYMIVRSKLNISFGQVLFLMACLFALGFIGVLDDFEDSQEKQKEETDLPPTRPVLPGNRLLEEKAASLLKKAEENGSLSESKFPVLRARFPGLSDRYSDERLIQFIRKKYENFFEDKSDSELIDLVESKLAKKEKPLPEI
jgi:hypothetical protein